MLPELAEHVNRYLGSVGNDNVVFEDKYVLCLLSLCAPLYGNHQKIIDGLRRGALGVATDF